MSSSIRTRSASAPVELREIGALHNKNVYKEELETFIDKYKEKSKLHMLVGLPPEIQTLQTIVDQTKSLFTNRTPISNANKNILYNMIAMNREHRAGKKENEVRLRDSIIDLMVDFYNIDGEIKLLSFDDVLVKSNSF